MNKKETLRAKIAGLLNLIFVRLATGGNIKLVDECKTFRVGNTQFSAAVQELGILAPVRNGKATQWKWSAGHVDDLMIERVVEKIEAIRERVNSEDAAKRAAEKSVALAEQEPLPTTELSTRPASEPEDLQAQILDAVRANNILLEQMLKEVQKISKTWGLSIGGSSHTLDMGAPGTLPIKGYSLCNS
ncbi:hypothetical protein [Hahella ganghwensis]|uniref:hypothetical protein n=1 Tax=Hahella ganghwensis TaxID=286420 RepID=UPI00035FD1FC|nr:hypothetical protein [Hahella ganghwensis]